MTDKNNFEGPFDDENYDEVLDENFDYEDGLDGNDFQDDIEGQGSDFDNTDYEEEYVAAKPVKEKKSFLSFNTILIGGAVIVVVVIMMTQMKPKDTGKPVQEKFTSALKMDGSFSGPGSVDQPEEIASMEVKPSETAAEVKKDDIFFGDNQSDNEQSASIQDTPPMPTPITSDPSVSQDTPAPMTNVVDMGRNDQNLQDLQNLDSNTVSVDDEKFFGDENLSSDTKKIDETEQPLTETPKVVSEKPVNTINDPLLNKVESSSDSAMLSQKLDAVLSRIDDIEKKMNDLRQNNDLQIKSINSDIQTLNEKIASLPKLQSAPVTKSEPAAKQVKQTNTEKPVTKVVTKPAPKAVSWELRAAQPDKAWVSIKGQKDMRPVVIGDSLTGIGVVKSIELINGKWVVKGSSGKITQ